MYDQVCYDRPFLKEVIARVDYLVPIPQLEKTLPPKIANEVARAFPIAEPAKAVASELQVSADEFRQTRKELTEWHFFGEKREKRLTVATNAMLVSYRTYTTYEDLKAEFMAALGALAAAYPDSRARRLGLRYVNQFEVEEKLADPLHWDGFFHADLLSQLHFLAGHGPLARVFNVIEFKYESIGVRFSYGLPNPDFPAVIKRPQFIVDLDGRIEATQDINDISVHLDQIHARIQHLFEQSITPQLREMMRARPQQAA